MDVLAEWDGSSEQLQQTVTFTIDTGHFRFYTREQLFEKAFSYVMFYQKDEAIFSEKSKKAGDLFDTDQYRDFDPDNKHLELLHGGRVWTIKNRAFCAGHFTYSQLEKILNEDRETFHNCLTIFHNTRHTIHVRFDGHKWMVFDPNYRGQKAVTNKLFADCHTLAVAKEIIDILGHNICLEAATFADMGIRLAAYEKLYELELPHIMSGAGTNMIAQFDSDRLNDVISRAYDENSVLLAIVEALKPCDSGRITLLQRLSTESIDNICRLLKLSYHDNELRDQMLYELTRANKKGITAVHDIFSHLADELPSLLRLVRERQDDSFASRLFSSFKMLSYTKSQSPLHNLMNKQVSVIGNVMEEMALIVQHWPAFATDFIEALSEQDNTCNTPLHYLIKSSPNLAAKLLSDLENSVDGFDMETLCQALATCNEDGDMPLHFMQKHAKQTIIDSGLYPVLLRLADDHDELPRTMINLLSAKDRNDRYIVDALLKGHCFLGDFFQLPNVYDKARDVLDVCLSRQENGLPLFFDILEKANDYERIGLLNLACRASERKGRLMHGLYGGCSKNNPFANLVPGFSEHVLTSFVDYCLGYGAVMPDVYCLLGSEDSNSWAIVDLLCVYGGADSAKQLLAYAQTDLALGDLLLRLWPKLDDHDPDSLLYRLTLHHPMLVKKLINNAGTDTFLASLFRAEFESTIVSNRRHIVTMLAMIDPESCYELLSNCLASQVLGPSLRFALSREIIHGQGNDGSFRSILPRDWKRSIDQLLIKHHVLKSTSSVLGKRGSETQQPSQQTMPSSTKMLKHDRAHFMSEKMPNNVTNGEQSDHVYETNCYNMCK